MFVSPAVRRPLSCLLAVGVFAAARFTVVNQHSAADSVVHCINITRFDCERDRWGFKVMPVTDLTDTDAGFLVDDRLSFKVEVVC